jgi:hypothetical protein
VGEEVNDVGMEGRKVGYNWMDGGDGVGHWAYRFSTLVRCFLRPVFLHQLVQQTNRWLHGHLLRVQTKSSKIFSQLPPSIKICLGC